MSVNVTFEIQAKPEHADAALEFMNKILPDTRAFGGCEGLQLLVDADDSSRIIVFERWDARESYEKYLAWRDSSGTGDELGPMLVGPPTIRYYEIAEVYP